MKCILCCVFWFFCLKTQMKCILFGVVLSEYFILKNQMKCILCCVVLSEYLVWKTKGNVSSVVLSEYFVWKTKWNVSCVVGRNGPFKEGMGASFNETRLVAFKLQCYLNIFLIWIRIWKIFFQNPFLGGISSL